MGIGQTHYGKKVNITRKVDFGLYKKTKEQNDKEGQTGRQRDR